MARAWLVLLVLCTSFRVSSLVVYRQWHVPAGLAGIYAGAVFPSIGGRPTFFWTGHEVAALVVDLGSCMLKASFAGDDATGAVFS